MSSIRDTLLALAILWSSSYPSFSATVCPCPRDMHNVCGEDGKTYLNECLARCDSVNVKCDGNCPCKENRGNFSLRYIDKPYFKFISVLESGSNIKPNDLNSLGETVKPACIKNISELVIKNAITFR